MKIGTFAKKYNTNISTIRHYMDRGLLLPQKNGGQYDFTSRDCMEMELILELKSIGFHLVELERYINITRLYDRKDSALYSKLYDILAHKHNTMELEKQALEKKMMLVSKKILEIEQLQIKDFEKISAASPSSGVPLEFLPFMACPHCHNALNLDDAAIYDNSIHNGVLHCSCGYEGLIRNGIIFTGNMTFLDDQPEFFDLYYGGNPFLKEFDSMLFECIDQSSTQFLTSIYKAGLWVHDMLKTQDRSYSCVLFPDISTHFLYSYHTAPYLKNSLILITALTEQALIPMKKHLESLNTGLKIVYFVNQDGNLPLKNHSIDLMIDFLGTMNLSLFSRTPYLDLVSRYFKPESYIAGAAEYYDPRSVSLKNIQKLYKDSHPAALTLFMLKETLIRHHFEINNSGTAYSDFNPGEYFEYHEPEETCNNFVFFAERNPG